MDTRKLRVIELSGTPRNRGRVHGEELRDDIQLILNLSRERIGSSHGTDPDDFIRRFMAYGQSSVPGIPNR